MVTLPVSSTTADTCPDPLVKRPAAVNPCETNGYCEWIDSPSAAAAASATASGNVGWA